VQRGGAPTAADRMLASQLGIACVDGLLEGRKSVMAGIMNSELVYTPFIDTITKQKSINPHYIDMVKILSV
jgi:6-phosphofructokinase 1